MFSCLLLYGELSFSMKRRPSSPISMSARSAAPPWSASVNCRRCWIRWRWNLRQPCCGSAARDSFEEYGIRTGSNAQPRTSGGSASYKRLISVAMRPAGAIAMLAVGLMGVGWCECIARNRHSRPCRFGGAHVRSVEPAGDGLVRIVLDETKQRTINGRMDDAQIRGLLLAATRDPPTGFVENSGFADHARASLDARRVASTPSAMIAMQAWLKALDGLKSFIGEEEVRGALADACRLTRIRRCVCARSTC